MQAYSDPSRESDPHALPDLEVFQLTAYDVAERNAMLDDEPLSGPGWFYWFCFPGCMPDSDPCGPFATSQEALDDAREQS
jgi:hypothetical protein